jgi:hypothetical protein
MRGVSTIIVVVMMSLVMISLVGMLYAFSTGIFSSVSNTAESNLEKTTVQMAGQFTIVSSSINNVLIRNTGQNDISGPTVMVNGALVNSSMTPSVLKPNQIGIVKIYGPVDYNDEINIISGSLSMVKKASDPCKEAIACYRFEEGSGSTINDQSGNNNMGTFYARQENLILYSQDYSNAMWNGYCGPKNNLVQNTADVLAPDGTQTAAKFTISAVITCDGSISRGVFQTAIPAIVNGNYTASIWLRGASGGEQISFGISDYHYKSISLTNQWVRYNYSSYNTHPGERGLQFFGTSPNAVFYVWGAQLEKENDTALYTATTNSIINSGTIAYAGQFPSPWTSGKSGTGLYFNGNENYVMIGNYITQIAQPAEVTYSAWVKLAPSTESQFIVGWWWTDSTGIFIDPSGKLIFAMYEPVGCVHPGCNYRTIASSSAISWNQWNFVAASFNDSADAVDLVVNGAVERISFPYSPHIQPGYSVAIGKTSSGWPSQYPRALGTIDEVRIYNKAIY